MKKRFIKGETHYFCNCGTELRDRNSIDVGQCLECFATDQSDIQTSDIHHTFKPHGQFNVKEEKPKEVPIFTNSKDIQIELDKKYNQAIDDVIKKLKTFTETTYPYKIETVFEEIEKLKKQ
jgi:hypothetical protein